MARYVNSYARCEHIHVPQHTDVHIQTLYEVVQVENKTDGKVFGDMLKALILAFIFQTISLYFPENSKISRSHLEHINGRGYLISPYL